MKMRFVSLLLTFVSLLTISAYLLQLTPKETTLSPEPVMADQRITVRIHEHDESVNVYSDEIPLTNGWQCYTQDTCRRYGIPYALMLGLMETESSFRLDADSGWAYGVCQIGYINEEWLAAEGIDMYTVQGNIEASCVILADYLSRYDTELALMAYNCGEAGAQELWYENIISTEYSRSVMEAAERWEEILNDRN